MGLLHNGTVIGGNSGEVLYSGNNHEANWSQDRLTEFNAYNRLTDTPDQTINLSGITGQVEDGVFTLSGTATAPFNFNLYNDANALPDWWVPGADINLIYERTGSNSASLYLRIMSYDANGNATLFGDWNRSATIHVPNSFDGVGLIIRLYVRTGATVDGSVHPVILNAMTNEQLTETAKRSEDSLKEYNAFNMLPHLSDRTIDSAGLTGSVIDDTITVSGTTTGPFNLNYYSSPTALPDWWVPGKDVSLIFNATGTAVKDMLLRIIYYDSNGSTHNFGDYKTTQVIRIPASFDGVGLIVRFYVPTGRTVDGSVKPQILNAMSNEELTKHINQSDVFTNPPMLTIIDDDGNVGFYNDLLPLVESRGVSISSAVISDRANTGSSTHMTWAQIEDASKRGAEIVNHTFDHLKGDIVVNMTEQEIWLNYQKARNTLAAHGLSGAGYLVYAGASGSYEKAQSAAKHSSKCAFHAGGNALNYRGQFDRYYINRYRVQTDGYNYDPEQLKALVDYCLANGGWMVWMIHTSETVWTTQNGLAGITAAVDYAIEKGLPVVSVATGYKYYID